MNWIKKNRLEVLTLLIILLAAAFLRFYRLDEYMTFLGDEGRDALMIKRILVEHDFPLIGPVTSIGNIYLGPLYYYMMAVPMAVFWLNPVAATGMVAVIGVATIALIYYLARSWFGFLPAVLSATLYAISPVTIIYSRSSWNPNPAPFFSLLAMIGLYWARKGQNYLWLALTGGAVAAALQMHYLALILLPIFGLLWLNELIANKQKRYFWQGTALGVVAFLFLMSPLVIFDFRYNFLNYGAITALFSQQDPAVGNNILTSLTKTWSIYQDKLISRYMAGENIWATLVLAVLVLLPLLVAARQKILGHQVPWSFFALGTWIVGGIGSLSLYRYNIYDHYLGFLNPSPYLLFGASVMNFPKKFRLLVAALLILVLAIFNFQKNPLQFPPNRQLQRTQEIARYIIEKAQGRPFNFALIAQNNYDTAYQFYLDRYGSKPKVVPVEATDQLFVVCEDPVCNPINHPKYEIAGFGWVKVAWMKEIAGVKLYKLVPNPLGRKI